MKKIIQKTAFLYSCVLLACLFTSVSGHAESRPMLIRDENSVMTYAADDSILKSVLEMKDQFMNCIKCGVDEHGNLTYHLGTKEGIYAVTDGSDLPEAFLHPEWMPEEDSWITYEEIYPDEIAWTEGAENWFSQYPENARLFHIKYDTELRFKREQLTKKLSLEYDEILDTCYRACEYSYPCTWDGTFSVLTWMEEEENYLLLSCPVQNLLDNDILPLKGSSRLEEINAFYQDWSASYTAWRDSVDLDSMTPAQAELSRKQAGVLSDYEAAKKAFETADAIYAENEDILDMITPGVCARIEIDYSNIPWTSSFYSTWTTIGDINCDGKITAGDASALLTAIAKVGTGQTDSEQISNADLNADNKFDSTDAALLLNYAAQSGSGNSQSLKEFLKPIIRQ